MSHPNFLLFAQVPLGYGISDPGSIPGTGHVFREKLIAYFLFSKYFWGDF
jgi:hypothetical protein